MRVRTLGALLVMATWAALILYVVTFYLIPAVVPPIFNWFVDSSFSRNLTAGIIALFAIAIVTYYSWEEIDRWERHRKMLNGEEVKTRAEEKKDKQDRERYKRTYGVYPS